ncbi:hypothetical protein ACHAXR_012775 [Thalassiosira sp. AJA248-18]
MMARQTSIGGDELIVPLPQWMEGRNNNATSSSSRQTIHQKTTIAYGIAELLRYVRSHPVAAPSQSSIGDLCNYYVVVWKNRADLIQGVGMLSPQLSVSIAEPLFLYSDDEEDDHQGDTIRGRYLEVAFSDPKVVTSTVAFSQHEEDARCVSLGKLLYEIFSPHYGHIQLPSSSDVPLQKKQRLTMLQTSSYLGIPASISLEVLIQNLMECREEPRPEEAYESLEGVIRDLHLLLLDPNRFLFERAVSPNAPENTLSLKDKLYGRESEVTLITDAFCRVSKGKSEAFFIGGYSGSGKTRLVNSLTARVDCNGGYILKHKYDQVSKESPVLELISVFNELCLVIKEKRSKREIENISLKLRDAFGADFSVLERLLPSVGVLVHLQSHEPATRIDIGDQSMNINLHAVCFMLQRFFQVVSTASHPVMLFLDDIQWCDKSSLTVVETILSDMTGSGCLFVVCNYRNNEANKDHILFSFMESLESSGLTTTKVNLKGLKPADLNSLISDTLCMLPRICESNQPPLLFFQPLSDIVFKKTQGNPFFAVSFLRTLMDEKKLLVYSRHKRRWVWDEDSISSLDITGNVLYLLTSKMNGLPEGVKSAMKVVACFGTNMKVSLAQYLSATSQYSNILSGLEECCKLGFMIKAETKGWRLVHDKVREAAYSLIPTSEKNRINHGMELVSPDLRCDISKLNKIAGIKAESLEVHIQLAKAAHSCGDLDDALDKIQRIFDYATCLDDKLEAYHIHILLLCDKEQLQEAYKTTREVLIQLGEVIPESFTPGETQQLLQTTSTMLSNSSESSLLKADWNIESKLGFIFEFYSIIYIVAFSIKPGVVPFSACRMVQLILKHGSKYAIMGLVKFAAVVCFSDFMKDDIPEMCRICELAMSTFNNDPRYTDQLSRVYVIYYAFVAPITQPLHLCAEKLRRAFECGVATGYRTYGFGSCIHDIRLSILAGTDLPTLLKRIEYYLKVMKKYGSVIKLFLRIYHDTISMLMGRECNSAIPLDDLSYIPADTKYFHKAIRAYWLGHTERFQYLVSKIISDDECGRHHKRFFVHYYGLNALSIINRKKSSRSLKETPSKALEALGEAVGYSKWNFDNKVHLLEAEICSSQGSIIQANEAYDAAILAAKEPGFIHEEGLACELAGVHYTKCQENKIAWEYFNQAKSCYEKWGSQLKVDSVSRKMDSLHIT